MAKVVKDTDLGTYMDYGTIQAGKLNPLLPANNLTPIAFVPTATGNTTNRNELVIDSAGNRWFIDYAGDGFQFPTGGGSSLPYFFNALSAEFPLVAQVNTTRVNVSGWTFPVVSGKSYKIEVISTFNSAVTTTGGSMGLITSGGATGTINGYFDADITNATVATGLKSPLHTINTVNTTAGSFMTTSGTVVVQPVSFTCTAVFTCTASGSVNVQWGTEIAGSRAFLRIGSSLIVQLLN